MDLEVTSDYKKLVEKLQWIGANVEKEGRRWAAKQAIEMDREVRSRLESQGRGGAVPPLSEMTRQIYSVDGEPDGSGIVNHLTIEYRNGGSIAILGIPKGKPTVVAKVQDQGATIPVTDRMRGFMAARYGIFLKQNTTHINVPGRHFWEDSLRSVRRKAKKDLQRLLRDLMR